MGKRKSRAKPAPKKRMDKLDTVFSCPFCNHGTSVECRLDMKNLIGEASCRICQESFSTVITALSEPIDIYSEWIDECERVNNLEDDGDQDEGLMPRKRLVCRPCANEKDIVYMDMFLQSCTVLSSMNADRYKKWTAGETAISLACNWLPEVRMGSSTEVRL
ncbi:Transcription elongation factor 1 - like 1 [Theobroma cacao]|nr:Transcription elongation factor 1 - like 1 [Theobroma cacao]